MQNKSKEDFRLALKKIILEKSYDRIRINEIVENSKLTRQTFYYYFKNLDELIVYFFEKEFYLYKKNNKREIDVLEQYFKFLYEVKEYIYVIYANQNSPLLINCLIAILKRHLNNKILLEINDMDKKDIEFVLEYNLRILSSMSYYWIERKMKENPLEMARKLNEIYFKEAINSFKKISKK